MEEDGKPSCRSYRSVSANNRCWINGSALSARDLTSLACSSTKFSMSTPFGEREPRPMWAGPYSGYRACLTYCVRYRSHIRISTADWLLCPDPRPKTLP